MKVQRLFEARCNTSHLTQKCLWALFCLFMTGSSVPTFGQQKPKLISARTISSSVPSGYQQVGNTQLYYKQSTSSIDFQGRFDNKYYGSTYSNQGYKVAMQVNGGTPTTVNCLNGSTLNGITFRASVEAQGELARICYTVTNTTETDAVVSLGTHADIMIGNNDRAPISRRTDTGGNTYGVTMKDGNGAQLCVLFGSGLAGVNSVSDFWFGHYSLNNNASNMVGNYSSGSNYMEENGSYDSGMGWCWKNRTIMANDSVVFSYLIGVGDVNLEPNSSFEVTPEDPDGWNDLSRPHRLTMEGIYESPAGLNGRIEYAVEDSEEWIALTDMLPSGSNFKDSLVAVFDPNKEVHLIRFRAVDNVGNTTALPPIEYVDVSFLTLNGMENKTYTGDSIYQTNLTCDLAEGEFQLANYQNNVNAGTASFQIEGVFPYSIGKKTHTFQIDPQMLSGEIMAETAEYVYNGNYIYPNWSFTNPEYSELVPERDYTVFYECNMWPGEGFIMVNGCGNYTGGMSTSFFIDKAPLTEDLFDLEMPPTDINYDGYEHGASISVQEGVGPYTIYYAPHDTEEFTEAKPTTKGMYDVYLEIQEGELYHSMERTFMGSFTIYEFSKEEWEMLKQLYGQLAPANPEWAAQWYPYITANNILSVNQMNGIRTEKGHVVELDLANQKLEGTFPSLAFAFPYLKTLDLSNNRITDNMQNIVQTMYGYIMTQNPEFMSALQTLNISKNRMEGNVGLLAYSTESYPNLLSRFPNLTTLLASENRFDQVYPHLPLSITTLDLKKQSIETLLNVNLDDLNKDSIAEKIPTLIIYNHKEQSYNTDLYVRLGNMPEFPETGQEDNKLYWGVDASFVNDNLQLNCLGNNTYKGQSGDTLFVTYPVGSQEVAGSYCLAKYSFKQGNANFIHGVDIADLQATINYLFGEYQIYPFNFTAADTYTDNRINVQDVVCTAQIIMDSEQQTEQTSPVYLKQSAAQKANNADEACIYARNGKLILNTTKPIAALDITFEGILNGTFRLNELGYQVVSKQNQGNTRVIAYTLLEDYIPEGETVIAEYSGEAPKISAITLADPNAQYVHASYQGETTSVNDLINSENRNTEYYSVEGIRLNKPVKGINIIKTVTNGQTSSKIIYIK